MERSSLDLASLATSWLIVLRAERKSAQTLRAYQTGVALFLGFSAVLDKGSVIEWLATMEDIEPATVRLRLAAVKQFTKWLASEGYLDADPILMVRPPKLDQKPVAGLSENEITRMLKTCTGKDWRSRRDKALILLMAETGLRAGEVVALDVTDVDLPGCTLVVRRGKGAKGRRVRFSPAAAAAIDRYLRAVPASGGPLWLGRRGRLAYTGLLHALNQRATQAGVTGFHPHRLRHTAAVRWLARGGSEGGLMAQAGWASREMIDRYVTSAREQLAADEFDRLDLGLG
jgi:integrase